MNKPASVDSYIASFEAPVKELLEQMRSIIQETAPKAKEEIAYAMPAYKLEGPLVYFAGYQRHIGFYPTGSGIEHFKKELSVYKGAKGSVQFPLDKPLPEELIRKIVAFRVEENKTKAALKTKK